MIAEQKAAYVNVRVARALLKMNGMIAENQQRQHCGESIAYDELDFNKVIDEERLGENDVCDEIFRE